MKKKIFTLLLAVVASIGTMVAADAIGRLNYGGLYYVLYTDYTATLTNNNGAPYSFSNPTRVTIPSSIEYNNESYTVTAIADGTFSLCGNLYEIVIPETIWGIGNKAFSYTGLDNVVIPNSVTFIGENAFLGCSRMTSIILSEELTSIRKGCFQGCSSLESIVIPDKVTSIGQVAFWYCSGLTSVTIGESVSSIYTGCFNSTDNITTVVWKARNCDSYNFGSQVTSFTFGNNVEVIPSSICDGMNLLNDITIPSGVIGIGNYAFRGCSGLTSVTIPNNVTSIGSGAFSGCSGLISIAIPNGVTSIGGSTFEACSGLTSITIPNSVTNIGSWAFDGCSSLTSVTIPNRVTIIGEKAFNNCSGLTGELIIPSSVQHILKNAFANCIGLTSIVIEGQPRLSANSFNGCTNLQGIYCLSDTPPIANAEPSCLSNTNDCPIYYPCGMYENYKYVFTMYLDRLYQNPDCAQTFTVTFQDWNGQVLKIEQVEKGKSATAPANPTREGYTFIGWDKDFNNVQSDLTVTAQYTQNTPGTTYYTVTFKDWNGTVLKNEQVEKGKSATAPADPVREGYTFTGWDKDFSNVQSDLMVTAQYTQNTPSTTYYTVTFKDWNGTILKSEQVEKGKSATAPANPTREGYTFIGWDKDFTNVQSNLIVTAKYQKNASASSFVGFESTNSHSLATQIYSEGLVQNISNVALVETDAASHKYSINLVNGGEGTFSMGGVVFSYTNAEAGKTAYKTYVQYIQPNGSDREIRIPTEKGQQVKVVLVEACAGILVDGVSKDFVAGENVLTSQNGTIVLKNGSAKPKISAILPLNSVGPTDAITVRLKASSAAGWSKVNLYYWGEGVTSPAWPGVTIKEDAEGWYSYTFASVTSVNIIWNDGNNQTQDISNVTESTCYSLKSTSGKTIGVNVVECEDAASVSVTGVSLNKKTLQMVIGNTATVTASVLPANASNKSVTWTSSNTATATVSSTGTISAKAEGVTTITCKTVDGNFTAECYVVVSAANSEYTFSYEPTNATVINYTATELSYTEIPENNCVFAILADNAHVLNLMYVGSLVNGKIPQGNYKITSTLQNGTFCYSVGGDDQYDYGSYMATDFDSEGYYTSAYYIIAGDITVGSKNNYTVKVVSANGTDINVTYNDTQDIEIVPSKTKASKILRNGQIFILRGEKVYTIDGRKVR